MSKEHLVDISKRPDFKEITARGGRKLSERKLQSLRIKVAKFAKCKNCKLKCDFKTSQIQRDPETLCLVPALRANALQAHTSVRFRDMKDYEGYVQDILELFSDLYRNAESERDKIRYANHLFNLIDRYKGVWDPALQKNVNLDIKTTVDEIEERIKKAKQMEESEKDAK